MLSSQPKTKKTKHKKRADVRRDSRPLYIKFNGRTCTPPVHVHKHAQTINVCCSALFFSMLLVVMNVFAYTIYQKTARDVHFCCFYDQSKSYVDMRCLFCGVIFKTRNGEKNIHMPTQTEHCPSARSTQNKNSCCVPSIF